MNKPKNMLLHNLTVLFLLATLIGSLGYGIYLSFLSNGVGGVFAFVIILLFCLKFITRRK